MSNNIITVSNISKKFKKQRALNDISFTIKRGSIFGLLGTNGAGKTTLVNILCGLLLPDSGKVTVSKFNLSQDIEKIRQLTAVVPQTMSLYSDLSVEENIDFFGSLYALPKSQLQKNKADLLKYINLYEKRHYKISELSGGYQRRCSIACALVVNPKILFFDEPLTGIDLHTKKLIMHLISKQDDLTVIFTTHSILDAEQICDFVVFMDCGNIVLSGKPKELVKKYSKIMKKSKLNLEDVFNYVLHKR